MLFGRHWLGLDIPRHIILFPPRLLARILSAIGYSQVAIFMDPAARDMVRSIGFYEADRGKCPITEVVEKPFDALYYLLAWPVALMSRFGWADRYHILARKSLPSSPEDRMATGRSHAAECERTASLLSPGEGAGQRGVRLHDPDEHELV